MIAILCVFIKELIELIRFLQRLTIHGNIATQAILEVDSQLLRFRKRLQILYVKAADFQDAWVRGGEAINISAGNGSNAAVRENLAQ